MNSYQSQLSVSTILNLDTGAAAMPLKPVPESAPAEQPFRRLLTDQAHEQQRTTQRRREEPQEPAIKTEKPRDTSPDLKGSNKERVVKTDEATGTDKPVTEVAGGEPVDGKTEVADKVVVEEPNIDGEAVVVDGESTFISF